MNRAKAMTFIIHSRKNHKGQRGADKRGRDRRHNTLSKPKASSRDSCREANAAAGRKCRLDIMEKGRQKYNVSGGFLIGSVLWCRRRITALFIMCCKPHSA